MPVIKNPHEYVADDVFVDLEPEFGHRLYLKCEGFNFAGSVKLKAAVEMISSAEKDGLLKPGSIIVESSSGNLGIALSMIAANRGYGFVCIVDPRCNPQTRRSMEAFGADVQVVKETDSDGGYLGTRIERVRRLCATGDRYVWLNQYANPANWRAHHRSTAPAIADRFPGLDVLFVGAGTTGTLMGCARYFRERSRPVLIVAVDATGSVTFGEPAQTRLIPGIGTSLRPELLDESYVDHVVHVSEPETIRACHRMVRRGYLFGGSTGTVIAGALRWLEAHPEWRDATAVAIAPDLGERYLDSIYQESWVWENYGAGSLETTDDTVNKSLKRK